LYCLVAMVVPDYGYWDGYLRIWQKSVLVCVMKMLLDSYEC